MQAALPDKDVQSPSTPQRACHTAYDALNMLPCCPRFKRAVQDMLKDIGLSGKSSTVRSARGPGGRCLPAVPCPRNRTPDAVALSRP